MISCHTSFRSPKKDGDNGLALDCPLNSPWVFKSDESKGDGASIVLQFNVTDFSVFEEEILNVSLLDVHRKIPHIDAAVRHGGWSSGTVDRVGDTCGL